MALPYEDVFFTTKIYKVTTGYLFLMDDKYTRVNPWFRGDLLDPKSKFTIENASTGGGLIHIRGYDNKYLVREEGGYKLKAAAEKKEEDQSSPRCALFRATRRMVDNFDTVSLVYVQLNRPVGMYPPGHYLGVEDSRMVATEFRITDARKLVKLPKRVVLKGINDRFLGHGYEEDRYYNKFDDTVAGVDTAEYRIIETIHGYIQVKSGKTGMFLGPVDGNWIRSAYQDEYNPVTWFEPVKSYALNKFCTPLTRDGHTDCLNASVNKITKAVHIVVQEPLLSREVKVIRFRFQDARTYNDRIVAVITKEAYNRTTSTETQTLSFTAETLCTGHWRNSESLTVTENFGFTSDIPKAGLAFEFTVDGRHSEKYTWGASIERGHTISASSEFTVPSMTRTTVRMIDKAISYEIPFIYTDYTQLDDYKFGTSGRQSYEDGVYTGANAYDFACDTFSKPLQTKFLQGSSLSTVNEPQLIPIWPVSTVGASIPTTDDSDLPTVDARLLIPDDAELAIA